MICLHPLNYVLEWEICFLCVCLSVDTCKILSFFPCYTQMYFCFISAWLPKNNNNAMFSMVYVVFPFFLYIRWVGDTSRVSLQQTGGGYTPIFPYSYLFSHLFICSFVRRLKYFICTRVHAKGGVNGGWWQHACVCRNFIMLARKLLLSL